MLVLFASSMFLLACTAVPFKASVKEDHFRFENFKRTKGTNIEYVNLMCFHKKPTTWSEPKQYLGGEHNLWVQASFSKRNIPNSTKVAFVNFKVDLEPNKSYMLNRKTEDDKVSIWIQEVDTGISVSDVVTTDLRNPYVIDEPKRRKQCKTSTV